MKHLFTFLTFIIIASPLAHAGDFPDVPSDHAYREAIEDLSEQGIISGHADGTYRPEDTINRAAIAKILIEATQDAGDITGTNCAPDVGTQWFAKYVCRGMELGYWKGYPDGNFYPERNASFVEIAKMVSLAYGQNIREGEVWYEGYVRDLESKYAIPWSVISFDHLVTRGELAEIIWRIQEYLDTDKSEYQIPENAKTYEQLQEVMEMYSAALITNENPEIIACHNQFQGCPESYRCYYSFLCPRGADCSQVQAEGDLLCHQKCETDSDCPSYMPICQETRIWLSDAGISPKICVQSSENLEKKKEAKDIPQDQFETLAPQIKFDKNGQAQDLQLGKQYGGMVLTKKNERNDHFIEAEGQVVLSGTYEQFYSEAFGGICRMRLDTESAQKLPYSLGNILSCGGVTGKRGTVTLVGQGFSMIPDGGSVHQAKALFFEEQPIDLAKDWTTIARSKAGFSLSYPDQGYFDLWEPEVTRIQRADKGYSIQFSDYAGWGFELQFLTSERAVEKKWSPLDLSLSDEEIIRSLAQQYEKDIHFFQRFEVAGKNGIEFFTLSDSKYLMKKVIIENPNTQYSHVTFTLTDFLGKDCTQTECLDSYIEKSFEGIQSKKPNNLTILNAVLETMEFFEAKDPVCGTDAQQCLEFFKQNEEFYKGCMHVHPDTSEVCFYSDEEHVYIAGEMDVPINVVTNVDPKTFVVLGNTGLAQDKNQALRYTYLDHLKKIYSQPHRSSFHQDSIEGKNLVHLAGWYFSDGNHVYFNRLRSTALKKVPEIDGKTAVRISPRIFKDSKNVYGVRYSGWEDIEEKNFRLIYSQNGYDTFLKKTEAFILPNIAPETFKALDDQGIYFADKNGVYQKKEGDGFQLEKLEDGFCHLLDEDQCYQYESCNPSYEGSAVECDGQECSPSVFSHCE